MIRMLKLSVRTALIAVLVVSAGANPREDQGANLVFLNGAVYTMDATRSWASAVAIQGNRIVFVGADSDAKAYITAKTRVIDLKGRMLLPGFHDSHVHPSVAGVDSARLQLDGLLDKQQVFAKIKAYAASHSQDSWILGAGWSETPFLPTGLPTRQMLDEFIPDRPAFFYNNSGHAAWTNTKALEIAGVTSRTPDPPNGRIERDSNGEPTGILEEYAAEIVASHRPSPTREEMKKGLVAALHEMSKYGVTSVVDAYATPDIGQSYADIYNSHRLPVRAILCLAYDPARDDDTQIREFISRRGGWTSGQLRQTCVKILLDGVPEHHTAAFIDPYVDDVQFGNGPLFVDPERLKRLFVKLDKAGFQIHVHTIGDRAVREALDAIAAAEEANGDHDSRPTLAHLDLVDPSDLNRFRKLGVVANMTPIWSRGDDWETVFAPRLLGVARSKRVLQTETLLKSGAVLVWGTDWPVTGVSPLEGIETAVTHRFPGGVDPAGKPDAVWIPEERVSLEQAIAAYTIAGAYLAHEEKELGSIETGKLADLVVLDKNLFEIPVTQIHLVPTDMTVLNGRIVFDYQNP